MIFVTVGTHEQPFNRVLEYMDNLKRDGKIEDEVIMQTGYSTYEPKYCEWSKMIPYIKMQEYVSKARIVVTHGGPASFIMPLQMGKIPIVVPRQFEFKEHVNNHQVDFVRNIAERMKTIISVLDIKELDGIINDYDQIVDHMQRGLKSNNVVFNQELEKIVDEMFGGKRHK
ncbi:MAG TPA: multidrug MFS transporter [Lachnospiraceae bacterium]|jgi:UDP-N-acetylglucosamine transferase subunit ALG13|nr:multidrug MFS transporter [Lachnospiraceae bacterium]